MSRGWYPRRRGILEHLNNGRISLLDAGVHDFLCLTCDYRTGVAFGSAEKVRALCPRDTSLRTVQRSLDRLEKIGWIKRFRTPGARGNYPILVGKYFVTDASLTWFSVSLEKTDDWRDVQFDVVTDETFLRYSAVTDRRTELTPLKEYRDQRTKESSSSTSSQDHLEREEERWFASQPSAFVGAHFEVSAKQDRLLAEAFPWADRPGEYRRIDSWLEANPKRRPRRAGSFLHNWFSRILRPKERNDEQPASDPGLFDRIRKGLSQGPR
jgi:hypothetical protein